jgi:hypothetical protein
MKAIEVATELKKLVVALETNPEVDIPPAHLYFSCEKEAFMALARILPHPLTKGVDYEEKSYADKTLTYQSGAIRIKATVRLSQVCRLVSPAIPAKYECDPILSPQEDEALEAEVSA